MLHAHCMLYNQGYKPFSEYVILLLHCNSGCKYVPRYVIHTLPVMFNIVLFFYVQTLDHFCARVKLVYCVTIHCLHSVFILGALYSMPVCCKDWCKWNPCGGVCVCNEPNLFCSYKRWQGVTLFISIIEWDAKLVLHMGYFCCFLLL
jgi:hypothetical protein